MTKENIAILQLLWVVVWTLGSTAIHWAIARTKAAKGEMAELRKEMAEKADIAAFERHEAKLTEHDRRIQSLEHDFRHLPSLDLFHQLALDLKGMQGELKAISVTLKMNTEMTRRIDDYLLEHDK